MEVLAEIVLQILGWLFELFGELLLQMLFEALAEAFGHALRLPLRGRQPVRPWLAAIGYVLFGAAAGGLTLWLVPELYIKTPGLRLANLLITPVLAGLVMEAIGTWRERRDKEVLRLESFAYGYLFALAMATVRYAFGV